MTPTNRRAQRRAIRLHRRALLKAFVDDISIAVLICKRSPVLLFCELYEAVNEHGTAYDQFIWNAAYRYDKN